MDIPQIDVAEVERLLADGAPLLDVRNPDEYEAARLPGAVLVPLADLPDRLADVPPGEPLLIICRSGARSLRACEFLAADGRTTMNVAGGIMAWIESGRAVSSGPEAG
jgi:rhodanese-related sulfurtransferase